MSQVTPSHGSSCKCRCCNGHYREFRAWASGISEEGDRQRELEILDQLIEREYCEYGIEPILRPKRNQNPESRLKRHYDEVPDGPVETTF